MLRAEPQFRRLRDQVRTIADLLEENSRIPAIQQRLVPPKKDRLLTRARKVNGRNSAGLTQKAAEILAKYLPAAARAWDAGLKANKAIFNSKTGEFEETKVPDHKVRAECAEKIWHNVIGRPVERTLQISGNYKELSVLLEELKQSPEARRLLPPEIWGMVAGPPAETPEQSNVTTISQSGQKTG